MKYRITYTHFQEGADARGNTLPPAAYQAQAEMDAQDLEQLGERFLTILTGQAGVERIDAIEMLTPTPQAIPQAEVDALFRAVSEVHNVGETMQRSIRQIRTEGAVRGVTRCEHQFPGDMPRELAEALLKAMGRTDITWATQEGRP